MMSRRIQERLELSQGPPPRVQRTLQPSYDKDLSHFSCKMDG